MAKVSSLPWAGSADGRLLKKEAWTGRSTPQPAGRPGLQLPALRVGEVVAWHRTAPQTDLLRAGAVTAHRPPVLIHSRAGGRFQWHLQFVHLHSRSFLKKKTFFIRPSGSLPRRQLARLCARWTRNNTSRQGWWRSFSNWD